VTRLGVRKRVTADGTHFHWGDEPVAIADMVEPVLDHSVAPHNASMIAAPGGRVLVRAIELPVAIHAGWDFALSLAVGDELTVTFEVVELPEPTSDL